VAINPAEKLIINSFDFVPNLDPAQFRLTIDDEVKRPL
jgi:hypothetical protein